VYLVCVILLWHALFGELSLEEAMDLSQDRLLLDWRLGGVGFVFVYLYMVCFCMTLLSIW
jgi:hypothetical protein